MGILYTQNSVQSAVYGSREQLLKTLDPCRMTAAQALLSALAHYSPETIPHSWRVARSAILLAHAMRVRPESSSSTSARLALEALTDTQLLLGGLLHDIGKLCIPKDVLDKPGSLTTDERRVIERHVGFGEAILLDCPALSPALSIVSCHHERWDGCGYPYGLLGHVIPLGARITSICDAYDALTSQRVYRAAADHQRARQVLCAESGSQFDPILVSIFLSIPPCEIEALSDQDGARPAPIKRDT